MVVGWIVNDSSLKLIKVPDMKHHDGLDNVRVSFSTLTKTILMISDYYSEISSNFS
jgi:hypothetical protein